MQNQAPLNVIVTGSQYSEAARLSVVLSQDPRVLIAPFELLDGDEETREYLTEMYCGSRYRPYRSNKVPVNDYIEGQIFDREDRSEAVRGVFLPLEYISQQSLWGWLVEQTALGSFCVIEVARNPICGYVEKLRRLEQTFVTGKVPNEVQTEEQKLISHVEQAYGDQYKLHRACKDIAQVSVSQLCLDMSLTLMFLFKYMGLPLSPADLSQFPELEIPCYDPATSIPSWRRILQTHGPRLRKAITTGDFF